MSKSPITTLSGLNINSTKQGCYIPLLPTVTIAAIPANELRDGLIVVNSTTNALQVRINGNLQNVNTSLATTGGGLTSGIATILPSGPRVAVEVAGNQIQGFAYVNTTDNNIRVYNNGGWHSVAVV